MTHWIFAWLTSTFFPPVIGALGGGVAFAIFFLCLVGQLARVLRAMPETKGAALEQMEVRPRLPGPARADGRC
ncbi:MFS transporter [Arsenicicoccus dermatophilus]|uniref:MFS transporter n=1 Tax=Arsenicicoccus dermatophilus TaxID=1076331 RepID=UPI0039171DA3